MKYTIEIIERSTKKENWIYVILSIIFIILLVLSKYIEIISSEDIILKFLLFFSLASSIYGYFELRKIKKLRSDSFLKEELKHILYYNSRGVLLTENYIIPKLKKSNLIKYEDIILIYKKRTWGGPSSGEQYLNIVSRNGKSYSFMIDTPSLSVGYFCEPSDFSNIIIEKK